MATSKKGANGGKSAEAEKRTGGARTATVRGPGVPSIPLGSELAKILGLHDDQITRRQLSLPVYGNYCGRGHGDPTGKTPPIDAVDAVCREHNACYRLRGDFDRQCDRDLVESMPSAISNTPSAIGKKAGLLALLYFSSVEPNLALGEYFFKRTQSEPPTG